MKIKAKSIVVSVILLLIVAFAAPAGVIEAVKAVQVFDCVVGDLTEGKIELNNFYPANNNTHYQKQTGTSLKECSKT